MTLPPTDPTALPVLKRPALWAFAMLALAVAFVIATGLLAYGRPPGGGEQKDFVWMWAAGQCWLNVTNPYDYEHILLPVLSPLIDKPNAFAYAPQVAPLCMAIAVFSLTVAKAIMTTINLVSLAAIGLFVWTTLRQPPRGLTRFGPLSPSIALIIVALVVGSPMASHTLAMGQSSLLAAAGLVWGWRFAHTGRPFVAGVLLAIASIKPPFVLLPILWLLLDRQWWTLVSFAVTCSICALYPLLVSGPVPVLTTWIASMKQYKTATPNLIGFEHNMGLPNLLYAVGIRVPDLTAVACVGTVVLYLFRKRLDALGILAILTTLYITFGVSHDYDMLMMVPAVVAMASYVRGRPVEVIAAWIVAALLMMPQRVIRPLDVPVLLHWRTAVLCGLLAWIITLAMRRTPERA